MKMKRIASAILALLMVLSTLVIVPVAAETAGIPEIDAGYKALAEEDKIPADLNGALTWTEFKAAIDAGDDISEVTHVSIDDISMWKNFALSVAGTSKYANPTEGRTFYLTDDLDFSKDTTAITMVGLRYYKTAEAGPIFKGTFDGNGHTISNFVLKKDFITSASTAQGAISYVGLFAKLPGTATVKNLIIDSTCSFTMTNTTNATTNNFNASAVGAVAGALEKSAKIENVWNKADVTGTRNVGGIVGVAANLNALTNCTNDGTVNGGAYVGGMIGDAGNPTVKNCVNNGMINGATAAIAGGICGRVRSGCTISECVNNGILTGTGANWNGIMNANAFSTSATTTHTFTVKNCVNTARFNLDFFANPDTTKFTKMMPGIYTAYNQSTTVVNAANMIVDGCYSVLDTDSIEPFAGYSEWRVGKPVDLTNVPNVKDFDANASSTSFKITDAEGLNKFSELVNSASKIAGKTIYLANDIDMSGTPNFKPIGHGAPTASVTSPLYSTAAQFGGTFDGQGHTIDGLTVEYDQTQLDHIGLFGRTNNGAIVRNVIIGPNSSIRLTHSATNANSAAGAIVGQGGAITNCASYATVYANANAGGIVGRAGNAVNNCTNYGYVNANGASFAMAGYGATNMTGNANYGIIYSQNGIASFVDSAAGSDKTITNCYNGGVMSGKTGASGMVSRARTVTITLNACEVEAAILSRNNPTNVNEFILADGTSYSPSLVKDENTKFGGRIVGYSEELIVDVDLTYVPDITSVYEIVEGAFGLKEGKTDAKVMKISDAEGMRLFSAYVNVYDANKGLGKTFYLANDIDMKDYTFTYTDLNLSEEKSFAPIGWMSLTNEGEQYDFSDDVAFKGYFNGLGHTIDNLNLSGSKDATASKLSVFGKVSGIVANLVVGKGCHLYTTTGLGAFSAGIAIFAKNALIANTWNQCDLDNENIRRGGGIVAVSNQSSITNATNSGTINGIHSAGGIVGLSYTGTTIANSRNVGNVISKGSGNQYAGGIIGCASSNADAVVTILVNCENYGTVETNAKLLPAGLVSNAVSVQYANCYNYGALKTAVEGGVTETNQVYTTGTAPTKLKTFAGMNAGRDTAYVNDMLHVWYQENNEGAVRFVTTIDSLVYDKIVLTIIHDGKTATVELTGVYTSILAGTINTAVVDPASYGVDTSLYFATLTLTDAAGKTFTVQASAYVGDTAVLVGEARTITVA